MPLTLPKPKLSDDFVVPHPGVYVLEFIAYDDPEVSPFDPEKETIKLKFRLIDEDFPGAQVNEFFGWSTHPNSKLYPVLKALNGGQDIDFETEDLDLDDFVGKQIMGTIDTITKPRRNGQPGEMVTFAKLLAAAPMKRKKVRKEDADYAEGFDAGRQRRAQPTLIPPPPPPSTWDAKTNTWDDEDES